MINDIIHEYWKTPLPKVNERDISVDISDDFINDIVGIRRAGKTFLMFDLINKITKKTEKQATIYINFENRRLLPLRSEYLNDIIEFIYSEKLLEKYKRVYLFLDEIQKIEGWEKFIRGIYDEFKGKIKIFVSGSSANLLSKDYGKLLTGRHLTAKVFPLSFKEFLLFKNFDIKERNEIKIKLLFKEYLKFGGFPEVVLSEKKEEILNQLFGDVLSRDVTSRAEIRKENILEEFSYFLSSNITGRISFNKMANYFKTKGIKISIQTLENYFHLMKDAFLFFDNLVFSYKVKDQLQYSRKIYCIDNGLINLIGFKFIENTDKLYENTVAVELLRRFACKPTVRIFYWHDQRQREVDFLVKEGLKVNELIQVCCDISNPDTKKRELTGLLAAMDELKMREGLIITNDYEGTEKIDNKKIKYIPLWKWLLQ